MAHFWASKIGVIHVYIFIDEEQIKWFVWLWHRKKQFLLSKWMALFIYLFILNITTFPLQGFENNNSEHDCTIQNYE